MVEAPGYCPPGPKCLFHLTVYRHSRSPGTTEIGNLTRNLKDSADPPIVVASTKRGGNSALTADMAVLTIIVRGDTRT